MLNRMNLNMKLSTRTSKIILLGCLFLAVFVLLAFAMLNKPPPRIETEFGGAAVRMSLDRGWVSGAGDCVILEWDVEGIKSIYIDNEGKPGWGEMSFCPTANANILEIGITAQDGTRRLFQFDGIYLPNFFVYLFGFVGAASTAALALYYVCNHHLDNPFPLWKMLIAVLGLTLVGGLSGLSSSNLITDALSLLRRLFIHRHWQVFGVVLAGIIYLPLIVQAARRNLKNKFTSDLIVIVGFLLFILLLYLPFGFESIGHWEEWVAHAYLDGKPVPWKIEKESFIRFWILIPHTLAYIIDSESFFGYHLVNLLMLWGKLVLLYGILRQLKITSLYAFLITMLFMVYPVNSGLMDLRSLPMQFSMISLLATAYLILDYQKHPTRLGLLGIWLGLIFNVSSNESAYAIILVIPLLWWLRRRELTWKNFNLTAIWYLFPAFKAAYLLVLILTNRSFYRDDLFNSASDSPEIPSTIFNTSAAMVNVYRNTFVDGWQEALAALNQNSYWFLATVMLALVGGIAWRLLRAKDAAFLSVRQVGIWLVSSLLFIVPAVGVLIWIERYRGDLWRMYFYVPIAAAMVVFSLIALLTMLIARSRFRNAILIMLCLILMFPALSRLLLQHEHFVNSANRKAALLQNVLEIAPQASPDTVLILAAEMSIEQLGATDLADYHKFDLVRSIFYILYQPHPPAHAALCLPGPWCSGPRDYLNLYSDSDGFIKSNLPNILLLKIHEDLSVELVEQPSVYFGFGSDSAYDARRLYNPDAPLPPRAATMLGSARRE